MMRLIWNIVVHLYIGLHKRKYEVCGSYDIGQRYRSKRENSSLSPFPRTFAR
jgi:hypothetical protein